MTKKRADMTPEELKRARRANMTPEQLEQVRAKERVANMTPEQLEQKRERAREKGRRRRANMTPEQLEQVQAKKRAQWANMTPEQRERERENGRQRRANMTPEQRDRQRGHIPRRYGITLAQRDAMYARQDGRCVICGKGIVLYSKKKDRTCLDHNHATRQVRDLLCHLCNSGLGYFKESPNLLRKAAWYLDCWNSLGGKICTKS
jgi:hypothetical protein